MGLTDMEVGDRVMPAPPIGSRWVPGEIPAPTHIKFPPPSVLASRFIGTYALFLFCVLINVNKSGIIC